MIIDDFSTGKKRVAKLSVTPPPQQTLQISGTAADYGTPAAAPGSGMLPEPDSSYTQTTPPTLSGSGPDGQKPKRSFKISKKTMIIAIAGAATVLGGGSVAAYSIFKKPAPAPVAVVQPTPEPTPTEPPKPVTEASRLSGVQITPDQNKRRVTAVLIENSPDARPQSGMIDAGVVFEAIAEGGITRFVALYQEGTPDYIGPVRSVRPYFIDFYAPFDAALAHVGGSLDALLQIKQQGLKDLDQFQHSGAYSRVPNRYAPHNVYTSTHSLDVLSDSKGYTASTFTSWPRKNNEPSKTPNAVSLDFDISGFLYNPHFDYDAANNRYTRSMAGAPHTDERSGAPLTPTTVLALVMPYKTIRLTDGYRSEYETTGSGPMYVFQDGIATKGTWTKPDRKTNFTFTDLEGRPIALNPGQAWVSIVDAESAISFK